MWWCMGSFALGCSILPILAVQEHIGDDSDLHFTRCEDEAIHLQRVAGAKKCFFRKSDGGRETLEGWSAGMASPHP